MSVIFSAIIAGLLTSLSPCVISALPFVVNSSFNENKKGPLMLVTGLITSFVLLGVAFSLTTQIAGFEQENLRTFAAIIFLIIGLTLLIPKISEILSKILSPIANSSNNALNKIGTAGLWGQFILGLLLGFVWSPCSGPTLGLALTLVSKQNEIAYGAFLMFLYGLSASLPLLFIAYVSKNLVQRNLANIEKIYQYSKKVMGIFLIIFSVATLSGFDKTIEAFLISAMPGFMLEIITKF